MIYTHPFDEQRDASCAAGVVAAFDIRKALEDLGSLRLQLLKLTRDLLPVHPERYLRMAHGPLNQIRELEKGINREIDRMLSASSWSFLG